MIPKVLGGASSQPPEPILRPVPRTKDEMAKEASELGMHAYDTEKRALAAQTQRGQLITFEWNSYAAV